jgi:hypothetical protein
MQRALILEKKHGSWQPWFLATMVPPDAKGLKRFSTMLWAFIQNYGVLKIE